MFKGRHFDQSVILLRIRRYLTYNLSLRDLEGMMAERGMAARNVLPSMAARPIGRLSLPATGRIWLQDRS